MMAMLTREDIEFLMELQNELNTQDNDYQASPIFWGVMEQKKVPAHPGCGDIEELVIDSETSFTEEQLDELKEWMNETDYFYDDDLDSICDFEDAKNLLELNDFDCEIYSLSLKSELSRNTGAFLTKRACQHHIEINSHNLTSPRTYAMTADRNFEYEKLLEILKRVNWEKIQNESKVEECNGKKNCLNCEHKENRNEPVMPCKNCRGQWTNYKNWQKAVIESCLNCKRKEELTDETGRLFCGHEETCLIFSKGKFFYQYWEKVEVDLCT